MQHGKRTRPSTGLQGWKCNSDRKNYRPQVEKVWHPQVRLVAMEEKRAANLFPVGGCKELRFSLFLSIALLQEM